METGFCVSTACYFYISSCLFAMTNTAGVKTGNHLLWLGSLLWNVVLEWIVALWVAIACQNQWLIISIYFYGIFLRRLSSSSRPSEWVTVSGKFWHADGNVRTCSSRKPRGSRTKFGSVFISRGWLNLLLVYIESISIYLINAKRSEAHLPVCEQQMWFPLFFCFLAQMHYN